MSGKAESWAISYFSVTKYVNWDDFIIDLVARFKDGSSMNVVEQLNKLQQLGYWKITLMYLRT